MRRAIAGFLLRAIVAVSLTLLVWWLFTTPFDRIPLPRSATVVLVGILDFPVAVAGDLLAPIRGMELVFQDGVTWCDFCPAREMFWLQARLAVPVYILLFYVPTVVRSVRRRNAELFRRIVIGLSVYALFTSAYFILTGDRHTRTDLRVAAMWLLILSAAAAVAWSKLAPRAKAVVIAAVLLAGAGVFPVVMTFTVSKMDEVRPYYVSYLLLLIMGVAGTLWLTWAIEWGLTTLQRRGARHMEPAS